MEFLCVLCKKEVRERQEAMECDVCKNWQHRTCNSGISRPEYRRLIKEDVAIEWLSHNCKNESIALFESDVVQSSLNLDETIQVSFFISYFP